eukprot:CAMPEP_0197865408 /NCGR_PEP_ID=MMETSP1438-20131217/43650_1 /TAXON_ID=1461541 /ORGANISM="Pterosperma sp., Strain CCMP1384" /LENGTH=80 /DNA_ID=CAMNT_0043483871 /DNA_START=1537 /DNA_END=1779 /DNA_ORIENTATION=-
MNEELAEVQQIMTRNIQEVLGQGERLDQVTRMSNTLAMESKKYAGKARDLSRQALIRKYMPLAVVLGLVLVFILLRVYVL